MSLLLDAFAAFAGWWGTLSPRTQAIIGGAVFAACILLTGLVEATAPEGMCY